MLACMFALLATFLQTASAYNICHNLSGRYHQLFTTETDDFVRVYGTVDSDGFFMMMKQDESVDATAQRIIGKFDFPQNCSLDSSLSTEAFAWDARDPQELQRVFGVNGSSSSDEPVLTLNVTMDAAKRGLTFVEDGGAYTVPRHGSVSRLSPPPCKCQANKGGARTKTPRKHWGSSMIHM